MSEVVIYHNPRCAKSRQTLELIRDAGIEPQIVKYLENPPKPEEFKRILAKLDMKPLELLRKEEKLFKDQYKGLNFTDEEWIQVMIDHPELMQRPVVVAGSKAVVGRPPENAWKILKK